MKLSFVSPIYNATPFLEELVTRIINSIPHDFKEYEIIFVDDFSPDNSWDKIVEISKQNPKVKGYKLSRNFGQHYAITAGLNQVTGDYIVVLDCDLQDQPEEVSKLYSKIKEGYDKVLARRYNRQDSFLKKMGSRLFYNTLGYLTGAEQDATVANFGIYSRKVIDAVIQLPEKIKYFPTMVRWVGFSTSYVEVEHASRKEGKSNYNYKKLFTLALDIILAYSDKPLRLIVKFGILVAMTSFLFAFTSIIAKISGIYSVSGYASIITSIWFLSGCIILTLGVVGLYVGKIFEGVKNRPTYIIEKSTHE